jgi:stage V sporulation protein SpoVS
MTNNIVPDFIKIGKSSNSKDIGYFIYKSFSKDNKNEIIMKCIGAEPVNQATKAIIEAKKLLMPLGITISEESYWETIDRVVSSGDKTIEPSDNKTSMSCICKRVKKIG